jgi:hypothetical protein
MKPFRSSLSSREPASEGVDYFYTLRTLLPSKENSLCSSTGGPKDILDLCEADSSDRSREWISIILTSSLTCCSMGALTSAYGVSVLTLLDDVSPRSIASSSTSPSSSYCVLFASNTAAAFGVLLLVLTLDLPSAIFPPFGVDLAEER